MQRTGTETSGSDESKKFEEDGYVALYGVFSGSDGNGYEASQYVKQKLAELIFADDVFFTQPTVVLKSAMEAVHADLLSGAAGTSATCTAAL